jgi:hypothetical protein
MLAARSSAMTSPLAGLTLDMGSPRPVRHFPPTNSSVSSVIAGHLVI